MQRLTTSPAFNPFIIHINGKRYEVGNIILYKADGTVIRTNRGWFGYNNNIREGLEIPDVLLRRKEKFDGETFAIIGKKYNTSCAFLYIPFEFFDFEQTEEIEDCGWYAMYHEIHTSRTNKNIVVEANAKMVVNTNKKAKAGVVLDALIAAHFEVERLKREYKKIDPYQRLLSEYKQNGIIKGDILNG